MTLDPHLPKNYTSPIIDDVIFDEDKLMNLGNASTKWIIFFIIVTIVGNLLVIISFIRDRRLKVIFNLFVVHLAVADILMSVTIVVVLVDIINLHTVLGSSSVFCQSCAVLANSVPLVQLMLAFMMWQDRQRTLRHWQYSIFHRPPWHAKKMHLFVGWVTSLLASFLITDIMSTVREDAFKKCRFPDRPLYVRYTSFLHGSALLTMVTALAYLVWQARYRHTNPLLDTTPIHTPRLKLSRPPSCKFEFQRLDREQPKKTLIPRSPVNIYRHLQPLVSPVSAKYLRMPLASINKEPQPSWHDDPSQTNKGATWQLRNLPNLDTVNEKMYCSESSPPIRSPKSLRYYSMKALSPRTRRIVSIMTSGNVRPPQVESKSENAHDVLGECSRSLRSEPAMTSKPSDMDDTENDGECLGLPSSFPEQEATTSGKTSLQSPVQRYLRITESHEAEALERKAETGMVIEKRFTSGKARHEARKKSYMSATETWQTHDHDKTMTVEEAGMHATQDLEGFAHFHIAHNGLPLSPSLSDDELTDLPIARFRPRTDSLYTLRSCISISEESIPELPDDVKELIVSSDESPSPADVEINIPLPIPHTEERQSEGEDVVLTVANDHEDINSSDPDSCIKAKSESMNTLLSCYNISAGVDSGTSSISSGKHESMIHDEGDLLRLVPRSTDVEMGDDDKTQEVNEVKVELLHEGIGVTQKQGFPDYAGTAGTGICFSCDDGCLSMELSTSETAKLEVASPTTAKDFQGSGSPGHCHGSRVVCQPVTQGNENNNLTSQCMSSGAEVQRQCQILLSGHSDERQLGQAQRDRHSSGISSSLNTDDANNSAGPNQSKSGNSVLSNSDDFFSGSESSPDLTSSEHFVLNEEILRAIQDWIAFYGVQAVPEFDHSPQTQSADTCKSDAHQQWAISTPASDASGYTAMSSTHVLRGIRAVNESWQETLAEEAQEDIELAVEKWIAFYDITIPHSLQSKSSESNSDQSHLDTAHSSFKDVDIPNDIAGPHKQNLQQPSTTELVGSASDIQVHDRVISVPVDVHASCDDCPRGSVIANAVTSQERPRLNRQNISASAASCSNLPSTKGIHNNIRRVDDINLGKVYKKNGERKRYVSSESNLTTESLFPRLDPSIWKLINDSARPMSYSWNDATTEGTYQDERSASFASLSHTSLDKSLKDYVTATSVSDKHQQLVSCLTESSASSDFETMNCEPATQQGPVRGSQSLESSLPVKTNNILRVMGCSEKNKVLPTNTVVSTIENFGLSKDSEDKETRKDSSTVLDIDTDVMVGPESLSHDSDVEKAADSHGKHRYMASSDQNRVRDMALCIASEAMVKHEAMMKYARELKARPSGEYHPSSIESDESGQYRALQIRSDPNLRSQHESLGKIEGQDEDVDTFFYGKLCLENKNRFTEKDALFAKDNFTTKALTELADDTRKAKAGKSAIVAARAADILDSLCVSRRALLAELGLYSEIRNGMIPIDKELLRFKECQESAVCSVCLRREKEKAKKISPLLEKKTDGCGRGLRRGEVLDRHAHLSVIQEEPTRENESSMEDSDVNQSGRYPIFLSTGEELTDPTAEPGESYAYQCSGFGVTSDQLCAGSCNDDRIEDRTQSGVTMLSLDDQSVSSTNSFTNFQGMRRRCKCLPVVLCRAISFERLRDKDPYVGVLLNLIFIVALQVLCWFPISLLYMCYDVTGYPTTPSDLELFCVCLWCARMALQPFLYAYYCKHFRKNYVSVLCWIRKLRR